MEMQQKDVCNEINGNVVHNDIVSAEDMSVDEFIDFSKAEEYGLYNESEEKKFPFHLESINVTNMVSPTPPLLQTDPYLLSDDEQENWEWLLNFLDDYKPEYTLTKPVNNIEVKPGPKPGVKENSSVTFCVQTKPRSKRVRNGARVWSLNDSTSSSSSLSSCSPPSQQTGVVSKQLVKKQKQHDGGEARQCSHCLAHKTPQWRAGPMGPKTLCNACGVRYKSGRLLPEYRPAISPTFSSDKNSNNHRKVMEMRRKKGDAGFVISV